MKDLLKAFGKLVVAFLLIPVGVTALFFGFLTESVYSGFRKGWQLSDDFFKKPLI